jgi:2-aminoadipate transaminase
LLKVTSRQDVISFAGGLPAAELFQVGRVKEAVAAVLGRVGGKSLQYGETEGVAGLRDWIAQQFSRPGFQVKRENVLITSGAQQALDLVGRVVLDPGNRVAVENPTYLALLSAWRPLGVEFVPVPSDADGMRVETLPKLPKPKLIYLVPNFQNPQGTTLCRERRNDLVNWCRTHEVALLEDNPYGELRYSGHPLPHLFELDATFSPSSGLETGVIYTGTFSKILMPGLRVGWTIAPKEVIDKLVQAKQAADLHTSTLCQYIALELISKGFLDEFLPVLRKAYRERRDVMLAALEKHFPEGALWTRPDGGLFLLVTLPIKMDAAELLDKALQQNVAFVPGEEFHLHGEGKSTMRLNFSNASPERIRVGIEKLGRLCRQEMDRQVIRARPGVSGSRGMCPNKSGAVNRVRPYR